MLETQANFLESRATLDDKIVQSQRIISLLDKDSAIVKSFSEQLNKIDDLSAEMSVSFKFALSKLEESKSQTDKDFFDLQIYKLSHEIEKLIARTDEILQELDVLKKSSDLSTTKAIDVVEVKSDESKISNNACDEKSPITIGWIFIAFIVGMICWLIWRNHDFTQAVMIAGKPVAFKLKDASSWWAAVLAGCTGFTATIFIRLLALSIQRGDR